MTETPPEEKRFRPRLWATLITIPTLIVLIGLGSWQVSRYAWKTEIIDHREAQLAAPAVALSDDGSDTEFRRVLVTGEFLHDKEMFLAANRDGQFGFHLITPLRRPDGSFVLINRGWISPAMRDPLLRKDTLTPGVVTIEGIIRSNPGRSWLSPDNDLAKNYWFWRDFKGMADFAGIEAPMYMVEAKRSQYPRAVPIGREFKVEIRNEHMSYVIIWYSLSIALIVIYYLSQRAPTRREEPD